MSTVLVIGAGFTRAAAPSGAGRNRCPPLDADFFQVADAVNRGETNAVTESIETFVGNYTNLLTKSLELSSTYLYLKALDAKRRDVHHLTFLKLLNLLSGVLASTTNSLRLGRRSYPYRFLLNELHLVDQPEDLTVITFNYDLVIERILEEIEKAHPGTFYWPGCYRLDGLRGSRIKGVTGQRPFDEDLSKYGVSVLKLHGSLNWVSKHSSREPTASAITNPRRELNLANSRNVRTTLTYGTGPGQRYLKPIIVPPISGKRGLMHRDILPLWDYAAEALQEASRVVVVGYSCPPLDLEARILLAENLGSNTDASLYVVNPDTAVSSQFVELAGVNHVTAYRSLKDWVDGYP